MRKLLFNINSTSWFHTLKSGGVLKIEVYYLIMCITAIIATFGLSYDVINGLEFSGLYHLTTIPFLIFILEYLIYSITVSTVPKEIQDKFWKTQLWRFKDPSHTLQKEFYPNIEVRIKLLSRMWEAEYGETPDETLSNAPWLQKNRWVFLIVPVITIPIINTIILAIF